MNRIINTFKYGSGRVKRDLALTILAGLAAIALLVCSLVFSQMFLFLLAIVFVFVTITMAQTFGIHSVEDDSKSFEGETIDIDSNESYNDDKTSIIMDKTNDVEEIHDEKEKKQFIETVDASEVESEEIAEKKKIFERFFKKKDKKKKDKKDNKDNKGENKKAVEEKNNTKKTKDSKVKDDKEISAKENGYDDSDEAEEKATELDESVFQKTTEENNDNNEKLDEELDLYLDELIPEEEHQKKVIHQLDEEAVAKYNKKKVKKVMKQYKVKRDHKKVIVDRCEKLGIKQTPAFVWIAEKQFNILLIEKEPRHLKLPIFGISAIEYRKKQEANPDIDYAIYKGNNMIAQMFGDYVPDYLHSTVVGDVTAYKNLYSIGPDMRFTNKSAAHLFEMLGVDFLVEDKVTTSNKVNIYFKDAYKANILLRDNVYDANGYADRISVILGDMAKSTISYNEFKETLNLMIKNKLITEEFAEHYIGVRNGLKR